MTKRGEPMSFLRNAALHSGDECVFWPFGKNGNGYGMVYRGGKLELAHRVSCEMINGPAPTKSHEAAHSCGNGHLGCVIGSHLIWKTHAENMRDMVYHGRSHIGTSHYRSKLSEDDISFIRENAGVKPQEDLAKIFGVSPATIHRAMSGRAYSNLPHTLKSKKFSERKDGHCLNGHLFTEETTYINSRGYKSCKICRREAFAKFKKKQQGQSL